MSLRGAAATQQSQWGSDCFAEFILSAALQGKGLTMKKRRLLTQALREPVARWGHLYRLAWLVRPFSHRRAAPKTLESDGRTIPDRAR